MLHVVDSDRLRAAHGGNRLDQRVLVGRILVIDRHVAALARRNVDQLLRRVPTQRIDTVAIRQLGDHLAGRRIDRDRLAAAA